MNSGVIKTVCLIGNPNCGKTTLFNALTGSNQRVGNWSGVTVEKKTGEYKKDRLLRVIDLPGIYSLSASSPDEKAVVKYLKESPPDVIIDVIDGTKAARNFFLTCNLSALGIPVVVAVNMSDELQKNGISFDIKRAEKTFGVPFVTVSAKKNRGVDELMQVATRRATLPKKVGGDTVAEKYAFAERVANEIVNKKPTAAERFTEKADKVLTHKVLGIPILFAVMTLIYTLSIKGGGLLSGLIADLFDGITDFTVHNLVSLHVQDWAISLVRAVIDGVGTVTAFAPQVIILFLLLALCEQSGYAARTAFIMDRFFRTFGLGGKSVIPLSVCCGCTVPGLMATRTIGGVNERRMTIILAPFMPCGAKTAVFAWFSSVFFGGNPLIAASLYFLGIICVALFGFVLHKTGFFRSDSGYILEIPTMRLPDFKSVFGVIREKLKEFFIKTGTLIVAVSVALWVLKNFGPQGYVGNGAENGLLNTENSFLFYIGDGLKYIFYPLGFGNWKATVSVLSGIMAKEAVIETFVFVGGDYYSVFDNGFSVYAFLAFVLLSPPCIASIITAKKELGSFKLLFFMLAFQFVAAYLVALLINCIGLIVYGQNGLLLSVIIVIIISLIAAICFNVFRKKARKGCALSCADCLRGCKWKKNRKQHTTI